MKKITALLLVGLIFLSILTGCSSKTNLDPENPVTLNMWHVYGEQADSPMNKLVEEFNRTVGKEKGIIINVTLMSSTAQIGEKLLTAQKGGSRRYGNARPVFLPQQQCCRAGSRQSA